MDWTMDWNMDRKMDSIMDSRQTRDDEPLHEHLKTSRLLHYRVTIYVVGLATYWWAGPIVTLRFL